MLFSCDLGILFRPIRDSLRAWQSGVRMWPKQQQKARHDDLFRARLDRIVNLKHALVVLADKIDWTWLLDLAPGPGSTMNWPGISATTAVRRNRCVS